MERFFLREFSKIRGIPFLPIRVELSSTRLCGYNVVTLVSNVSSAISFTYRNKTFKWRIHFNSNKARNNCTFESLTWVFLS